LSRAYYRCAPCATGCFPYDESAGLEGRYSPAVRPLIALAGTLAPFRTGAEDILDRFAGLDVSASSCRRVTEAAGRELVEQHQAGVAFCPQRVVPWDLRLVDEDGKRLPDKVLYLGVDAFAVRTRTHGGLTTEHKMLYVGLLYDPAKKHTVYLTERDLDKLVAALRRYAVGLGLGQEGTVTMVALMDGGNGLVEAVRSSFSDAVQFVLDYYHAAEYLHALANAVWGEGSATARSWAEGAKSVVWEQGGEALLEHLQTLVLPEGVSEEGREKYRRALEHIGGNVHRLDYPSYRARDWDVGSGPTEAGCKLLKGRLDGTGMRWLVGCSAEVGALRALYASREGQWDTFFNPQRRSAA
jgi:hypothetical protein